jgi:hypothetical protein
MASGELLPDLDVDLITDMLVGPVSYRQSISGPNEVSGTRISQVVDIVLEGILARPAAGVAVVAAPVTRAAGAPQVATGEAAAPASEPVTAPDAG